MNASHEGKFSQWAAEAGVTACERVGDVFHFACDDGTTGSFSLLTGAFVFHHPCACAFCGDRATQREAWAADEKLYVCDACSVPGVGEQVA